MKTGNYLISLAVLSALVSEPLVAQSVNPFDNHGRVETRAMAGITIPLGGKRRGADSRGVDTKPRFDLRFDTSRIDAQRASSLDPLRLNRRDVRQSVFSVTLEKRPQLMMNGHAFAHIGPRLYSEEDEAQEGDEAEKEERSTGEKVLRGAGWVGIGALAVLGVGAGAFLLSCGDGECFVDD